MFPTSGKAGGLRISLFVARGQFSQERCFRVAEWIEHLALSGWRHWVLDFTDAGHVDFRGFERLLRTARLLETTGGAFCWCGMSPYLRDISLVAGAHDRPVYPDSRAAVMGLEVVAA